MRGDFRFLQEVIPPGQGFALDLGGGTGLLRPLLEKLGYRYLNLDIQRSVNGYPTLFGDAHALPFKDAGLDVIVMKDSLEHFLHPAVVMNEVHRALMPGGYLVIWVPFMHPFHGDDYWRFTPLALRTMLRDFTIERFDSPLWVFNVMGLAMTEAVKRLGLGFFEPGIKDICRRLDGLAQKSCSRPRAFAGVYRIVACKRKHGG